MQEFLLVEGSRIFQDKTTIECRQTQGNLEELEQIGLLVPTIIAAVLALAFMQTSSQDCIIQLPETYEREATMFQITRLKEESPEIVGNERRQSAITAWLGSAERAAYLRGRERD